MSRRKNAPAIAACHAEGLTVPEAAARLGLCDSTVYNWAKRNGVKFANRKMPPPKLTPEQEAVRHAAHKAAMVRRREGKVNGWSWRELAEAGFTVREAAEMRGQSMEAAYRAEVSLGIRFYRIHIKGLDPVARNKMHRARTDYGVSRDAALEIIERPDLIQPRPVERVRQIARIKHDPEAALIAMMAERRAHVEARA